MKDNKKVRPVDYIEKFANIGRDSIEDETGKFWQKLLELHGYTIDNIAKSGTTEREIVAIYMILRPCNIVAKLGRTKNLVARMYQHLHNKQRSNLNVMIKEHPWWEQDMYSYKVDFVEVPVEYLEPIERLFLKWFRPGKQS